MGFINNKEMLQSVIKLCKKNQIDIFEFQEYRRNEMSERMLLIECFGLRAECYLICEDGESVDKIVYFVDYYDSATKQQQQHHVLIFRFSDEDSADYKLLLDEIIKAVEKTNSNVMC